MEAETIKLLRNNISYHVQAVQGEEIEDYLVGMYDLIDKHDRVSISACHAVGKTFGLSRGVVAIQTMNPMTKIITTAPTFRQVKDLLWKEIHSAYQKLPPFFKIGKLNEVEWQIDSESFAKGFSPAKNVQDGPGQGTTSTFQGYHAKYMLVVIFDEATGVEPQIWTMAEGLLTSGKVKFICIANPTSRNSRFFKTFSDRNWVNYKITCFMTPNLIANGFVDGEALLKEKEHLETLTDEEYLKRLSSYKCPKPYLITARWVMEKLLEWGYDHPLFQSKCLGEFPLEDDNALIPERVVDEAMAREVKTDDNDIRYIGVDVARFGIDKSVFTEIQGWKQIDYEAMAKCDTITVVSRLIDFIKNHDDYGRVPTRVAIDAGFGHGVIDLMLIATGQRKPETADIAAMHEMYQTLDDSVEILEINFGSTNWVKWHYGWKDEEELRDKSLLDDRKVQEDRENYMNYKAKGFDILARDLRNKLALMQRQEYKTELPAIIMQSVSDGKLKIESKEDYKKRTGETSPDSADSLMLANLCRYYAVRPLTPIDYFYRKQNG